MDKTEPGYIKLFETGELKRRADILRARLVSCDICPRECGVNRKAGEHGYCHSAYFPVISSYCAHHGEEPPLSGSHGSGTIFFGNCNMRCVYCQNFQISQSWRTQGNNEVDIITLAGYMLYLQNELNCHNINLVTPSHFVPQILLALLEAIPSGLHIPLVYNTSGYDLPETIKMLDGVIDIYLPDIRYSNNKYSIELSRAPRYVECARGSIKEMYRQTGKLVLDNSGIAIRGLIIRHLILPGQAAGSKESLKWLAEQISLDATVSIMAQYYPVHKTNRYPLINRRISLKEYTEVERLVRELGLTNGWMQEMDAPDSYQPDFGREGNPFE